jgi:allantoicase
MFYSSAGNLIAPGNPGSIAGGWETARRRDGGHDWVLFALAGAGRIRRAEIDTSHFTGNAPGEARLLGIDARTSPLAAESTAGPWRELLPRTRLRPDTLHRFRVSRDCVTHVRMEIFPDGGMARVRLLGELEESALTAIGVHWLAALPETQLAAVLTEAPGLTEAEMISVRTRRPFRSANEIPTALWAHLIG